MRAVLCVLDVTYAPHLRIPTHTSRAYGGEQFKDQPTVLATDLGGNVVPSAHGSKITMSLFQNTLDGRLCDLNGGKLTKLTKHQSKLCSVRAWRRM